MTSKTTSEQALWLPSCYCPLSHSRWGESLPRGGGPRGREPRPAPPASRVGAPYWKWTPQLEPSLQRAAGPANILLVMS